MDLARCCNGRHAAGRCSTRIVGASGCRGHCPANRIGRREVAAGSDLAIFTAGVTTQGNTTGESLAANSVAMENVVTQLRRSGIVERDIKTSNLVVEPIYPDPNREAAVATRFSGQPYTSPAQASVPKIVGYRANNSVSAQRDLKTLGRVIDTMVAAGAKKSTDRARRVRASCTSFRSRRAAATSDRRQVFSLGATSLALRHHRHRRRRRRPSSPVSCI